MTGYDNKYGRITNKGMDFIEIDSVRYPTTTGTAISRRSAALPEVGDRVEFNFNSTSKEIIFMKNMDRVVSGYNLRQQNAGYCEDPNDPDECHDMEAVYGHSFEGM